MSDQSKFAHECCIRDLYAANFSSLRTNERLVAVEPGFKNAQLRADLLTVDSKNVLREWEFKIHASYSALGQVLTYVALKREGENFNRKVKGVIAAFEFQSEVLRAIEVLNLGIEVVQIPAWMAKAGEVPVEVLETPKVVNIPSICSSFS